MIELFLNNKVKDHFSRLYDEVLYHFN